MKKTDELSKKDIDQVYGGSGKKVPQRSKPRKDFTICPKCGKEKTIHGICTNCGYSEEDRFPDD